MILTYIIGYLILCIAVAAVIVSANFFYAIIVLLLAIASIATAIFTSSRQWASASIRKANGLVRHG